MSLNILVIMTFLNIAVPFIFYNLNKTGINSTFRQILFIFNQSFLKMNLEESIIFTQTGVDKNEDLFSILQRNSTSSFLIYIPLINSFFQIYYVFLCHAAWKRIYNNQNGITAKEEIKIKEYNKNTVVN